MVLSQNSEGIPVKMVEVLMALQNWQVSWLRFCLVQIMSCLQSNPAVSEAQETALLLKYCFGLTGNFRHWQCLDHPVTTTLCILPNVQCFMHYGWIPDMSTKSGTKQRVTAAEFLIIYMQQKTSVANNKWSVYLQE